MFSPPPLETSRRKSFGGKSGIIQKENTHTVQGVGVENNTPLCGETYEYDSCVATRTSSLHSATKTSSCMPCLVNESTLALHQTQHYLPFSNKNGALPRCCYVLFSKAGGGGEVVSRGTKARLQRENCASFPN